MEVTIPIIPTAQANRATFPLDILFIGIPATAGTSGQLDSAIAAIERYIEEGYYNRRVARGRYHAIVMINPMIPWGWKCWHSRRRITVSHFERDASKDTDISVLPVGKMQP